MAVVRPYDDFRMAGAFSSNVTEPVHSQPPRGSGGGY